MNSVLSLKMNDNTDDHDNAPRNVSKRVCFIFDASEPLKYELLM